MAFKFVTFCAVFFGGFVTQAFAGENAAITVIDPIEFKDTAIQGEIAQSEIAALYDLPVSMGGNRADGVELTSPDETQKEMVSTCAQYKAHKDKGWLAMTTYDLSMESFFKSTCGRLDILSSATPAKSDRFGDAPYHLDDLRAYPASFLDPITAKGGTLCEGAKTLRECTKQRDGKISIEENKLHFTDKGYDAYFTPSVKADINGDGSEDMIFDYGYHITDGTFLSYGQICLEWPEGQELISIINCGIE